MDDLGGLWHCFTHIGCQTCLTPKSATELQYVSLQDRNGKSCGGFHDWGYPKNAWFIGESSIKMDDN